MLFRRVVEFLFPLNGPTEVKGIEFDLVCVKEMSQKAFHQAASDIGDDITKSFEIRGLSAQVAHDAYASELTSLRSEAMAYAKRAGSLAMACLVGIVLLIEGPGDQPLLFTLMLLFGMGAAYYIVCAAAQIQVGLECEASVRWSMIENARKVWAFGRKALYLRPGSDVQIIRFDAIGKIMLTGESLIVCSRFGEPSATFHVAAEDFAEVNALVVDWKSKID